MLARESYINSIVDKLSWMDTTVRLRNSQNLYDVDIHAESFFCELLNLIFGYKLENLNYSKKNYVSIDLGDRESKIAVQVTAQKTRAKIQDTLNKFIANGHQEEYDRLIVLIIGSEKPRFTKPFNIDNSFCFDAATDIWDTSYLVDRVGEKSNEDLLKIYNFFQEQLYPNEGYHGANLNQLGTQILSEMHSRCKAKLLSIGIDEETADKIIKTDIDSAKYRYILDEIAGGKQYIIGEFGSGKSHALLIIAQQLMKEYLSDNSSIFPLFVQVKEIARIGSLRQWIKDSECGKANYLLLIDGLDEIDHNFAGQLIEEINALSVQYPHNKILVASRPLVLLSTVMEKRFNIRPFTDEECLVLYNIISNSTDGEHTFRWISENMRKTLSKPFFCIIFALFKAEPKGWAKQDIDLIIALVTKSMQKAGQSAEVAFSDLASIASKAVDRNYGDVHISEIHFRGSIELVLATGFISLSNGYISFPLPIIAQWMAAEAIRRNIVDIDDIISNMHRIDSWLYSLSILFSQLSFEESLNVFARIVQKSPGIASRIIRDGIRFDQLASLPPAYECGEKLRKTMLIWIEALGPLSNWIAPINHGEIAPIGINVSDGRITYSWLDGNDDLRPVQMMSFHDMLNGRCSFCSRGVPAQATWPWIITFDYLSDNLKKAIQSHAIIPVEGQLQNEYLWDTLLHISRKGNLQNGKRDLTELEQYRQFIGSRLQVNGREIQTDFLFHLLDKRIADGETEITAPYPVPDKSNKSGWVWSGYSAERFLEKTQFVYSTALEEYIKLVNIVFRALKDNLRTAILVPCKLVGKIRFSEESVTFTDSPHLTWYMEALPSSETSCVDIQFGELPINHADLLSSLLQNNLRLRPDAENKSMAFISSGYLDIYKSTPVTNIVFSWLERELKEIGWIDK